MRGPYPKGRERRPDSTDALTRQQAGKLNIKRASGHDGARKSPHGENRTDGAEKQRYDVHVQWLENMTAMPVHVHTRL